MRTTLALLALLSLGFQDDDNELRRLLRDNADDFWIYDDLEAGVRKADKTGKPLLVSIR